MSCGRARGVCDDQFARERLDVLVRNAFASAARWDDGDDHGCSMMRLGMLSFPYPSAKFVFNLIVSLPLIRNGFELSNSDG
jgi:hypothetical protein